MVEGERKLVLASTGVAMGSKLELHPSNHPCMHPQRAVMLCCWDSRTGQASPAEACTMGSRITPFSYERRASA